MQLFIPANANQHDAVVLMRNPCRRSSNLSHPFRSIEHFPVTSVNEIARKRLS
jgi:hypothetical protein